MDPQSNQDFLISQMRILTMPEMTFFYVTNKPTAFGNLDRELDVLLSSLYEAKTDANLADAGPDITRYYKANPGTQTSEPDLYWMEVGIPVKPGTLPAGEAQIKTLPAYHCAGLLIWGSLMHMSQAHESLMRAIQDAGLERTGESREWNYWFESVDSPNNLIGLFMEVR